MYIYVSVYLYFLCVLYVNIVVLYSCVWLYYSYCCVVFCDWQGRTAVADCQINNQSINQSYLCQWQPVAFKAAFQRFD